MAKRGYSKDPPPRYSQPAYPPAAYGQQPYQQPYQQQPYQNPQGAAAEYYGGYIPQQQQHYPQQQQQQHGYQQQYQGMQYQQQPAQGYYGSQRGHGKETALFGICAGLCGALCLFDLCLFC